MKRGNPVLGNMEGNQTMKNILILVAAFLAFSPVGKDVSAANLTAKEILQRADESRGNMKGVEWDLQIDSVESDRQQIRKLTVKSRKHDFFAIIKEPPKVRGQILLSIDQNMWFASLSVRKPVPVSPRQKLLGSASYGDIAATNYAEDYDATALGEETVNGEACYVFDLKANKKSVTYDRIKYWVSKKRYVGVKAIYYTVSGKEFKSATFEYDHEVMLNNKARPFISKIFILDAFLKGNKTTMIFSEPIIGKIPDSVFDLNLLLMRTI